MFEIKSQMSSVKSQKFGIAALPTILMIGGLIVELATAAMVGAYLFNNSDFGNRLSAEAYVAARTGIDDAMIKIVRDKNFNSNFSLIAGNSSADVTMCKDTCSGVGTYKVTALGKSQSRRRNLEAILTVDSLTGEVRLMSLNETSI